MKTILIIILILSASVLVYACVSKNTSTSTEVDVLRDITDKELSEPNAGQVLILFNLSNMWNGAYFRFANLSDVSYTETAEENIEPANQWLSNELERRKEVKKFQSGVSAILKKANQDSIGKRNSSVYFPIARVLSLLTHSKAPNRFLLVYSDLMENDTDLSFYDPKVFQLLTTNPDSVIHLLEKRALIPRLDGIEIHFRHQPMNPQKDNQYRIVSGFYKSLLESKGATVYIGTL